MKRAPEILEEGAATYRQRNAIYGDNYLKFGNVMAAMFPEGLAIYGKDEFNKLGVFIQVVSKVTRYAEQLGVGKHGHYDSALDLCVYAAMLAELTKEK